MRKFTRLDMNLIRESYPKSVNLLKEWLFLPDKQNPDHPIYVPSEEEAEQTVNLTLSLTPRILFDFFDDKKIYISIFRNEDDMFTYYVTDVSLVSLSRNDAEQNAFILAFQELEKQL